MPGAIGAGAKRSSLSVPRTDDCGLCLRSSAETAGLCAWCYRCLTTQIRRRRAASLRLARLDTGIRDPLRGVA